VASIIALLPDTLLAPNSARPFNLVDAGAVTCRVPFIPFAAWNNSLGDRNTTREFLTGFISRFSALTCSPWPARAETTGGVFSLMRDERFTRLKRFLKTRRGRDDFVFFNFWRTIFFIFIIKIEK
jgi:hypothetical protein